MDNNKLQHNSVISIANNNENDYNIINTINNNIKEQLSYESLMKLTVKDLKNIARSKSVAVKGVKEDIVNRILNV